MFEHLRASGVPEGQSGPLQAKHESLDIKAPRAHVRFSVAFFGDAMTQDHADFIAKLRQFEELRARLEFGPAAIVDVRTSESDRSR